MIGAVGRVRWWLVVSQLAAALAPHALAAQAPLARAVLFYSPTCPHCHKVIQQDLPGIFAAVGGEPSFFEGTAGHVLVNQGLALLLVNVTEPAGRALYDRATEQFAIPAERQGYPRLICGDSVLVGDLEIPERFPEMIARGRAAGGIPWPAIDGLADVFPPRYDPGLARAAPAPAPRAPEPVPRDTMAPRPARRNVPPAPRDSARSPQVGPAPSVERDTIPGTDSAVVATSRSGDREKVLGAPHDVVLLRTLAGDPVGASVALALIVGMVASLAWIAVRPPASAGPAQGLGVPLLALMGAAIAAYLGYVETTGVTAVCGPVGDCNAVQQSPYARLLGVVPVALLGLVGYVAILGAWAAARVGRGRVAVWASVSAFLLALVGTAASLVFTVLEPFVIGAVCAWCLASAALMTALLWLLAGPGMAAARAVRLGSGGTTLEPH
jgi:uncharacterized membrane protein